MRGYWLCWVFSGIVVFQGLAAQERKAGVAGMAATLNRPNIIVIYTDDQGYGDVSCLNPHARFRTPNTDRLAREGIAFTNAHAADSVCTPSRYALLTGRYCWRTVKKRGVLGAEGACLIPDGRLTVASMLRAHGYHTAMVGKWHLGMQFPGSFGERDWSQPVRDMPLDKGFDYFFGIPASMNYGLLAWFEGRHPITPPTRFTAKKPNDRHVDYRIMPPYHENPQEVARELGRPVLEVAPDFQDSDCLSRLTDQALRWMATVAEDARMGKPFFLYLALTAPHYPVCPREQFWGMGNCGAYGEFVIEMDYHVGRILQQLEKAGLDRNTLIVFTSDNGPERSWRERARQYGHRSNGPFRGGKREIYEGGHRVPMLVRWPAGIASPGRQCDALVGQVDLLATLAEILGAELPGDAGEDSQSFAKVLADPQYQHQRWPLVNHAANGRFAVTRGHWKLVMPHGRSGYELYDLEKDPGETQNLAGEHPDLVRDLTGAITQIVCRGRTTPGPPQRNDTGYWSDLAWMTEQQYTRLHATR